MLAFSLLLSLLFIQVIAFFKNLLFYMKQNHPLHRYISTSISPPLTFCNEKHGPLSNSVLIYYWFIVA